MAQRKSPARPLGPCDIYAAGGTPCAAAYSTTRAMYAGYRGPLYQIRRQSDGKSLNIGVVPPSAANPGGYADAAAQDAFCAHTYCWITILYDQSPNHNNLTQAPRGGWSGPALGGMDNLPLASMAPMMVMGHKVYGVFIEPGMGLRDDDTRGIAVDDQSEGEYWVIDGRHFNSGCCYDFGNAEIDSRDDDAGTMETAYFGDAPWWYHGNPPGPWVMTDQENNLVGCVNPNGSKLCSTLPDIHWRFVTAMANGRPHHWISLGGNAQRGPLSVMFSGPRVNWQYDPMRKQGGIVLGNGGDNSNGAQGTFFEGAITAAGAFPSRATDQRVQANVVAARYRALPIAIAGASSAGATPNTSGLQIFTPRSTRKTLVTFTNVMAGPITHVRLHLSLPGRGWHAVIAGRGLKSGSAVFAGPIAPGAQVTAAFLVTSGKTPVNASLVAHAQWISHAGRRRRISVAENVRNVPPITINEFRIDTRSPANPTNSFIELYNSGRRSISLSHWTLAVHPGRQAVFSRIHIPGGATLAPGGFYLLGLAGSGLAVPAAAGANTLYLRSTAGMKVGDILRIGSGRQMEMRRIIRLGTPARTPATLWQPLPDGPSISIPAGSTTVPVSRTIGFHVGGKIALGYGATYPSVPSRREHDEIATVTAVGTPGTQVYLAVDAKAGATNIKTTSVRNISVGDRIRLDIDSVGHGIETVTVTRVGTAAMRARLIRAVPAGATHGIVFGANHWKAGDQITFSTPARRRIVTLTAVAPAGRFGERLSFTPALSSAFPRGAQVLYPGTGLDLAAPLRWNHSANLPFSDPGTGIRFAPATKFVHISNEPIQPLGTGVTLNRPLAAGYGINTPVRDAGVTTAGYQGQPAPELWFGGPTLTSRSPLFGRMITLREGSLILRNAAGLVVDSLNYGGLADPWAAEGDQDRSGFGKDGCYVAAPGTAPGAGVSAGRFPDGADTASNCHDFHTAPVAVMTLASLAGAANIKTASVAGFHVGQTIHIGAGANLESAVIAGLGTPGGTQLASAVPAGAASLAVGTVQGFYQHEAVSIGRGVRRESAVIRASYGFFGRARIILASPLRYPHRVGSPVSGSGIALQAPLTRAHPAGSAIFGSLATPGAPNHDFSATRAAHAAAAKAIAFDHSIFGANAAPAPSLPFVSTIFGDNMVLQRNKPDAIWGWSTPGDTVHVQISHHTAEAIARADGRWQVKITPPPAGGPYTLQVSDGSRKVQFHNVLVGDVWLCGGQSNMELPLRFTDNSAAVIKAANDPDIRYFTVGDHSALHPTYTLQGSWRVVSPQTASWVSAVAFYFGLRLEKKLHIPIGLVVDSVGGSAGETWAGAAALRPLRDYAVPLAMLARYRAEKKPAYGNYIMYWYDHYDIGIKDRWFSPAFAAAGWKTVTIPGAFKELGVGQMPSVAWFRKVVTLPDPLPRGPALIFLGEVQRMDSVYVNGSFVGGSAWVEHPRIYFLRPGILHPGRNLIAIRIFKTQPRPAFFGPPSALHLLLGDHSSIPLAGKWLGKVSVLVRRERGAAGLGNAARRAAGSHARIGKGALAPVPPPIHYANWPVMPTVLYNGMLMPIAPLSISGAIWYQGEQNSPRGFEYRRLLPAVIASWRHLFQQGPFPFYIVQLPGFGSPSPRPTDDGWADIRESQAIVARTTPNSCLAVTTDTGGVGTLHPGNKKPVGDRLAFCALNHFYGIPTPDSGPVLASIQRLAHAIRLRFNHTDGGLVVRGKQLRGFAIAGKDRQWHWARARIEGNAVIVSSPAVSHPLQVRYDWESAPDATLFNRDHLPAGPFRTDHWPVITQYQRPY